MKRYYTLINLAILAATSYFGVNAFYKIVSAKIDTPRTSTAIVAGEAPSEEETRHPLAYYNPIIQRNLFKTMAEVQPAVEKEAEAVDIENLKQTDLSLKLWGTVSGDRPSAYAVIEDTKARKQNLYREGDAIQDASVKMILREKVILTRNGEDEVLAMEKRLAGAGGAPAPRPAAGSLPSRPAGGEDQQIRLERDQIESAVNNVNNLMRQAKIRPHFKDGKPDGLTLTRVRPDSIFTKLGLRSGDIITGVDGQNIQSVDDALRFYQSLKSGSNVKVQIRRRGQEQNIEYQID
jgi:general secretion pathway protein C